MQTLAALLALPATHLCFIASSGAVADVPEWPYNLPPTVKYHPEHDSLVRRQLDAKDKLASQRPVGMRKMSEYEGEMFFLHYWDFGDTPDGPESIGGLSTLSSSNISMPLLAPLAPHFPRYSAFSHVNGELVLRDRQAARALTGQTAAVRLEKPARPSLTLATETSVAVHKARHAEAPFRIATAQQGRHSARGRAVEGAALLAILAMMWDV
ncbi:hypothetical protein LTR95_009185 [Oleoguttula sp. CCFEE 5521]